MKKEISLTIIYLQSLKSIGDQLIGETFNYLLNNIAKEKNIKLSITKLDYNFNTDRFIKFLNFNNKLQKVKMCLEYKFKNFPVPEKIINNFIFILIFLYWNKNGKLTNNYKNTLKNSNAVIFAGGGLFQHSYNNLWCFAYTIVQYCQKYNKNVCFNAIGIEKPDIFLENILYKYIFSRKCVKTVTTRDDIDYLKTIANKNCELILDPAMWASELRQEKPSLSPTIGIGVIRPEIFANNNIKTSIHDIINLYTGIIIELENRGYKWELFCNGTLSDYNFGLKLLDILNKDASKIAKCPKTVDDLLRTVTKYKAIIAARLHANIIATSFNIPVIGLVWNKKLLRFAEIINSPAAYITSKKFSDSKYIIDELEKVIEIGLDKQLIHNLKEYSYDTMKEVYNFEN